MEYHALKKTLLSIQNNAMWPDLVNQVIPLINSGRIKFNVAPQETSSPMGVEYQNAQNTEIATINVDFQQGSTTQENAEDLLDQFQEIVDRFRSDKA